MNKYINELKDDFGIKKDNPELKPFQSSLIKGTNIMTNDNTFFLAGKGSGKTTMLTLLMNDYARRELFTQFVYCFKLMEETFAENMKKFKGNLLYVQSTDVVDFIRKYTSRKQKYLEIYKWLKSKRSIGRESELMIQLRTIKPKQKKMTFDDYAIHVIEKYTNDFKIKCVTKTYDVVGFKGYSKTMFIYDDILNFPELFTKRMGQENEFFANFFNFTRHFLCDNFCLGHRYTNLSPDLRQSITNWFIGINVPQKDLKAISEEFGVVFDSAKEFRTVYANVDKFDFLFVNTQTKYVEVIKHDSKSVSSSKSDTKTKLKQLRDEMGDDEDEYDNDNMNEDDLYESSESSEEIIVTKKKKTIRPSRKGRKIIIL